MNYTYHKNKYYPGLSSTSNQTGLPFVYNVNNVEGYLVGDVLNIEFLWINSQFLGVAYQIETLYGLYPFDGVLGLGWKQLSQNSDTYVFDVGK
jgi:hypothetical protein